MVSPEPKDLKPAAPAINAPAPMVEILMNCLRVAMYRTVFQCVVNIQINCISQYEENEIYCFLNNSTQNMIFMIVPGSHRVDYASLLYFILTGPASAVRLR